MAGWGRTVTGLVGVAAVLLAGCAAPGDQPWAAEAEAWYAGHDAAYRAASLEHMIYYAPGGVNDTWDYYSEGRWATGMLQAIAFPWEHMYGPLFLSKDGAVRTHIFLPEGYPSNILLAHHAMSEDGIERHTHLAHTQYLFTIRHRQGEAMALADQVAADYVRAWNTADPELIQQLYLADAALSDDMHGVAVQGHQQLAALAAASGPVVARTNAEVIPQRVLDMEPTVTPEAPAVYTTFELDRAHVPTQVWLMLRSEERCPGETVVGLDLDAEQRVTAERRYTSIASMRECVDPADAPQGWWTGRDLPLPFAERVTGTLETAAGTVEIRNGWGPADEAVLWAYDRYAAAGLPTPVVSTIVFDPFDDRCEEFTGYAASSGDTTEILICFDSSRFAESGPDGLPVSQRGHLLHELGHAWLTSHTDKEVREAFMAVVGVDNWNDKGRPWHERGLEWAAETLAWGVQDGAAARMTLGSPDCAILRDGYRVLTGTEPLAPCPSAPEL